jgi:hypothetical protein
MRKRRTSANESEQPLEPTIANTPDQGVGASDGTLLVLLAGVIILLVTCIGFILIAA